MATNKLCLSQLKDVKVKLFGISLLFIIINRILTPMYKNLDYFFQVSLNRFLQLYINGA